MHYQRDWLSVIYDLSKNYIGGLCLLYYLFCLIVIRNCFYIVQSSSHCNTVYEHLFPKRKKKHLDLFTFVDLEPAGECKE